MRFRLGISLVALSAALFPQSSVAGESQTDRLAEVWHEVRAEKEGRRFADPGLRYAALNPQSATGRPLLLAGAGFELPADSKLDISGRKSVGFKMSGTRYFGERPGQLPPGVTFGLEQELQVRLSGTISKRVTVNVDYDDTKPAEDQQRDISVFYKGEPTEIVQEASFGDVTLMLPNTEFTGYNKKVFGAQMKAAYSGFRLAAIGAQTKGKTKTVVFNGRNTQIKKDIADTEYIQRKYYTILMNAAHVPIDQNSEQIWVDDLIGSNNKTPPTGTRGEDPTVYTQATSPGNLHFMDYQSQGKDYTIDYKTGVITFVRPPSEGAIIMVAYKYGNGASTVGYASDGTFDFSDAEPAYSAHTIQKDANDLSHQLKNFYNVGNQKLVPREYDPEFVFQVFDTSGQEISVSQFPTSLDVDFGIFQIFDSAGGREPFAKDQSGIPYDPNAYTAGTRRQSRYKMHIEYKYRYRDYVLPDRPIVKYSEKVNIDGRELRRDEDYIIDYTSGFLFFNNPDLIKDTSTISVTYEVLPFGGQFQSNLFGARGEWALSDRAFIGSTFLFSGSQVPLDVPVVGSTPRSHQILDMDAKLSITPDNMKFFSQQTGIPESFLPTSFDVSGELARSSFNPNTFETDTGEKGAAFLDSMEGIDELIGASTSKNAWFQSSRPAQDPTLPTKAARSGPMTINESIDFGHDTSSIAGKKTLLLLGYNLPAAGWDSVRNVISNSGSDWTRFTAVEIWVKGDWTQPVEFHTEFGIVSEDSNENGSLDTEDKNNDNLLSVGEDLGIPIEFQGVSVAAGADNGLLDTEDSDRSARLDATESYYRHSFTLNNIDPALVARETTTGWRLIKIPMSAFTATGSPAPIDRRLIKHVRIWLRGSSAAAGTLTIESISATGNKWEQYGALTGSQKFAIRAVSSDTDPSYKPRTGTFFRVNVAADRTREKALSLAYLTTDENIMARKILSSPINFLEFGQVRMDVYKKTVNAGDKLLFRLGPDENNYFQYEVALDSLADGWQVVDLPLEEGKAVRTVKGSPNMTNIKQMALGVRSTSATEGELWVNNLRVNEVKVLTGMATRLNGSMRFGDWLSMNSTIRELEGRFRLIDDASTNTSIASAQAYATQPQTTREVGVNGQFTPVSFLPATFGWTRRESVTDPLDRTNPNYFGVPDKVTDAYVSSLALRLFAPLSLGFDGSYQTDKQRWLPQAVSADNSEVVTWATTVKGTYAFPELLPFLDLPIGRNTFEGSYLLRRESDIHGEKPSIRNTEADSREQYYRVAGQYLPIDSLTIGPSLSYRFSERKGAQERWVPSLGDRTPSATADYIPLQLVRGAGNELSYSFLDRKMTVGTRYGANNTTDYLRQEFRTENNIEYTVAFTPPSDWTWLWGGFTIPSLNASRRITSSGLYQKFFGDAANPTSKVARDSLQFMDIWWITPREDLAFNSANVVNDSISSRFNVFQGFALSPKGSMTREHNQQQNFVTRTNTDSAGMDVLWERPTTLLLDWLVTPTALNTNFTWRNTKRFDNQDRLTSDADSYTSATSLPFQPSEGFNGSMSFRWNMENKLEGTRRTITRSYVPSLEFSHNLFFAGAVFNFWPFNGLKLDQAIRVTERFEVNMTRNQDEIPSASGFDVKLSETDRYTFGANVQYSLSQFARLDFSGDANYLNDRQTVGNNQLTWNFGVKLNATF